MSGAGPGNLCFSQYPPLVNITARPVSNLPPLTSKAARYQTSGPWLLAPETQGQSYCDSSEAVAWSGFWALEQLGQGPGGEDGELTLRSLCIHIHCPLSTAPSQPMLSPRAAQPDSDSQRADFLLFLLLWKPRKGRGHGPESRGRGQKHKLQEAAPVWPFYMGKDRAL